MNRRIRIYDDLVYDLSEDHWQALEHFEACAQELSALADPIRLMLVAALIHTPGSDWDLAERLDIELADAAHHLDVLQQAGLVTVDWDGLEEVFALADGVVIPADGENPAAIRLSCCTIRLRTR